jgi:anti-sigma B factor antagonist
MPLKVKSISKRPGVKVVSPIGSINAATYSILDAKVAEILENPPDVLIFDMEFTDYINSTGIRVLLKAKKAMRTTNGRVVFMNLQPQIEKVFDILKAIPTIEVFANIQELDRYLDSMQKKVR